MISARRILILGPPGSGKSTLARELAGALDVPVFHLDQAFWKPGWVQASADEFAAEVSDQAALNDWVIEGNYIGMIRQRLERAEMIIYLDRPTWLCGFRVLRRLVLNYGKVRTDGPPGCPERFDWEFLKFVITWNYKKRRSHLAIVQKFSGETMVLRKQKDGLLRFRSQ